MFKPEFFKVKAQIVFLINKDLQKYNDFDMASEFISLAVLTRFVITWLVQNIV